MSSEQRTFIQPCPCCEGDGCSECSQTGRRVTTFMDRPDGVTARISGNAPLSPESADALAAVIDAAYKQMGGNA